MGTFTTQITIGDPMGEHWEPVEALVDTGASYTWVPASVLGRLRIAPSFRTEFELAGGRKVEYGMAETKVRLNGSERTTIVVFGDENTEPLLGAYTWRASASHPTPWAAVLSLCRAS